MIDKEVREIVERNYDRARNLLTEKIDVLHNLAKALLEAEVLDSDEVEAIVMGLPYKKKTPAPASSEGAPPTGQTQESGGTPIPGSATPAPA